MYTQLPVEMFEGMLVSGLYEEEESTKLATIITHYYKYFGGRMSGEVEEAVARILSPVVISFLGLVATRRRSGSDTSVKSTMVNLKASK